MAQRYRCRYERLRRAARALVLETGALCDEVARLEAKVLRAREERRVLLTRLLRLRAGARPLPAPQRPRRRRRHGVGARDGDGGGGRGDGVMGARDGSRDGLMMMGSMDGCRDGMGARDGSTDASRDGYQGDGAREGSMMGGPRDEADGARDTSKPTASRDASRPPPTTTPRGSMRPPLSSARPRRRAGPRLPLPLGPLTIHELGVSAVAPGSGGRTLPLGFRSTRVWGRRRYGCRVVAGPRCEIVVQEEPEVVVVGPTPDACHGRLLQAIGDGDGRPPPAGPGAGDEFFGLSHPLVQQLLREEEEEEEDEDEDDDDDDDDDDEDGTNAAFSYGDIFLGSPTGSE